MFGPGVSLRGELDFRWGTVYAISNPTEAPASMNPLFEPHKVVPGSVRDQALIKTNKESNPL